jgi:hypothetical protein
VIVGENKGETDGAWLGSLVGISVESETEDQEGFTVGNQEDEGGGVGSGGLVSTG